MPLGQPTNPSQPAALPAATSQDTSAILEALKNMQKQNAAQNPVTASMPMPPAASLNNLLGTQFGGTQSAGIVNPGLPSNNGQAVNPLGALYAGMNNAATSQSPANVPQNPNPFAALLNQPQAAAPQNTINADAQVQLQLIQALAAQGVPPDQWTTALQMLNAQAAQNGGAQSNQFGGASRDRDAYTRSPPGQGRRRSRSPAFGRRRDESPGRRRRGNSPNGDPYRDSRRNGGGAGAEYRQRSPQGRRRRSASPEKKEPSLPPPAPRDIQYDASLPEGSIKVLSRTLFVGGVTQREPQLRELFGKFGIVQTCIVNVDKRHAFIKMLTRKDAERARTGMEDFRDSASQLRTKWGVGFGPRDCSDYQTGVSIIPMERLTDADRKWMVTAEYGGTGGIPMATGMVVEEPDIEIGAGVSSKGKPSLSSSAINANNTTAMSRRIATDQGGKRGPVSSRDGRDQFNGRPVSRDQNQSNNNNNVNMGGMPPGMPFNFPTMPNGMPMFPPNFFQNFQQGGNN